MRPPALCTSINAHRVSHRYNPVLGECFCCRYEYPITRAVPTSQNKAAHTTLARRLATLLTEPNCVLGRVVGGLVCKGCIGLSSTSRHAYTRVAFGDKVVIIAAGYPGCNFVSGINGSRVGALPHSFTGLDHAVDGRNSVSGYE